jgi:hypothetical protein
MREQNGITNNFDISRGLLKITIQISKLTNTFRISFLLAPL